MRHVRTAHSFAVVSSLLLVPCLAHAQITGQHEDKLPVPHVERPLTLPEMHGRGELDGTFNHLEDSNRGFTFSANGGVLEIGGAFGLTDDIELEARLISLELGEFALTPLSLDLVDDADWGVSRFGGTLRFVATDVAEIGARVRLYLDHHATFGFGGGVPIVIHGGKIVRLETGIGWVGRVPTNGAKASFGLVDASDVPMSADAGIPLRASFQIIDEVWLGLNTGFGAFDVS